MGLVGGGPEALPAVGVVVLPVSLANGLDPGAREFLAAVRNG